MRVLWITNMLPVQASTVLNLGNSFTGGWITGLANELIKKNEVELFICSVSSEINVLKEFKVDKIHYIVIPFSLNNYKYPKNLEKYWKDVRQKIGPDVVHIHGTEFPYGLAWLKACGNANVVASIQGLTSVYYRFAAGSLSFSEIIKNITLSDVKNRASIFHLKRDFRKRGIIEKEYIRRLKYVIGRTSWDRSHVFAWNPDIKYLFCNENLRPTFYSYSHWDYENCERHSIFLSQTRSPIKGTHMVFKALPLILRRYPNTKLYIANSKRVESKGLVAKLKQSGYFRLLAKLVDKLNLQDHVVYLNALNEKEMAERFIKSHVFVCASSIENSPNSLGEAQILGVPCVSSYVGGTPEFMGHGKAGSLYRFEEYEMLADAVCRIFEKKYISEEIEEGITLAIKRHDRNKNTQDMLDIYRNIIQSVQ